MKFMMMMHYGGPGEPIYTWPQNDIKAHIDFMLAFNERLKESGEFVDAQGLAGPETVKVVRAGAAGAPPIVDGPFAEVKELLAGFWIVDVDSERRAIELAATASAAPGKNGARMSIPIEVRQVMCAPECDV